MPTRRMGVVADDAVNIVELVSLAAIRCEDLIRNACIVSNGHARQSSKGSFAFVYFFRPASLLRRD